MRSMQAAQVLRGARRRAHLSQRALAARTSIAQPTIARIESGVEDPRWSTLVRLLGECGDELQSVARRGMGVDRTMIRELLALSPAARLDMLRAEAEAFDRLGRARRAP
jgi:predicted transcriptional regulator